MGSQSQTWPSSHSDERCRRYSSLFIISSLLFEHPVYRHIDTSGCCHMTFTAAAFYSQRNCCPQKKKKNWKQCPPALSSCSLQPLHTPSWYSVLSQTLATQINLAIWLLCWGVIKLFTSSQIETCNAVSLWNLKEIEHHQLCGLNTLA